MIPGMMILDILKEAYQGHDDQDDGINAEESGILWGHITKSSLLVQYNRGELVVFAPSKGAAYIAKTQFYRKAKRAGWKKLNPDKIKIGVMPDRDIQKHPESNGSWYSH